MVEATLNEWMNGWKVIFSSLDSVPITRPLFVQMGIVWFPRPRVLNLHVLFNVILVGVRCLGWQLVQCMKEKNRQKYLKGFNSSLLTILPLLHSHNVRQPTWPFHSTFAVRSSLLFWFNSSPCNFKLISASNYILQQTWRIGNRLFWSQLFLRYIGL